MNITSISKAIIICAIIPMTLLAQDPNQTLKQSSDYFNSLEAFSLSFKVKTVYDITDEERTHNGTLLVGKNDKFSLQHSEIEFLSDGVSIWEYRKKNNQVLVKSLLDLESSFHPSEILFKYLKCTPLTAKTQSIENKSYIVLTLDPTKQLTYLKSMEVWLNTGTYTPYRLKTVDVSDNSTWYTITNFNPAPVITKESFTFNSDKNPEIIDMR